MCRWLAFLGAPIAPEELLFKPKHSLIDQSMRSKSAETPTNGDGFGLGWYGARDCPGLFRSIRPAWNDFNLQDIPAQVESRLFLAHVRATSHATVQETNCHPFRHGNWLFVHNGEIFGIEKFRKRLMEAISDDLFPFILGTTDSEVMFFLALTFGLERNPYTAMTRMAGFVESVARAHGVAETLWMTLGFSDGDSLYAIRYASDGKAPTLYHSRDAEEVCRIAPHLRVKLSADARAIASEPMGATRELWKVVPENTFVHVRNGMIESAPFVVEAA